MKRFVLFLVTLVVTLGCTLLGMSSSGRDTCTQGENMTNPRLVNGLEEFDDLHKIRITWDAGTEQGASLPRSYFQAVTVEDGVNLVKSVALTAKREITVELTDLSSYLQNENTLELTLLFPDRRVYIDCRHAGMDDRYYLKISLFFAEDGTIKDTIFEQGVWLGPI